MEQFSCARGLRSSPNGILAQRTCGHLAPQLGQARQRWQMRQGMASWTERSAAQRSALQVMNGEPKTSLQEEQQHSITTIPSSDEESHLTSPTASGNFDSTIFKTLEEEVQDEEGGSKSSPALLALPVLGIILVLAAGFLLKDQIKDFLDFFSAAVEEWGPWGYVAYAATYTALEVLAVPAIPLTMTAGVVFGPIPGTAIVCFSGTLAAAIAFLIARYAMRDKILQLAKGNRRFAAIDKAIGKDGFKFVTLLRLSPLFPFAASNYLYGLTSVDLWPYVAGSFLGSLPGTYAYVSAGHVGKAFLKGGEGSLSVETWQVALGMGATLLALGWIGQMAKKAIADVEADDAT